MKNKQKWPFGKMTEKWEVKTQENFIVCRPTEVKVAYNDLMKSNITHDETRLSIPRSVRPVI